jgi:hypothetical protein
LIDVQRAVARGARVDIDADQREARLGALVAELSSTVPAQPSAVQPGTIALAFSPLFSV